MANISHFGVLSIITQQTEFSQSSTHLNYAYVVFEVWETRFINVAKLKACTHNNLYRSTVSISNRDMDRLDDRYRSFLYSKRASRHTWDVQRTTWGIARNPSFLQQQTCAQTAHTASLPWIQKPPKQHGEQQGRIREIPPKKNSRKKLKHPIVKTFQTALFEHQQKLKCCSLAFFIRVLLLSKKNKEWNNIFVLLLLKKNWEGNNILIVNFHDTHSTDLTKEITEEVP